MASETKERNALAELANDNETVEQIYAEAMQTTGVFPSRQTYAKRYLEAHKREVDELKTQIKIAKSAFFRICMCDHSNEIHDIFCEAEFMMNHPDCREDKNNG